MSPWMVVASAYVGALALAGVFFAIGHLRSGRSRDWVRTTGVVVNRRTGATSGGMPARYPTFRWTDAEGRVHQHTSSMGQSLAPAPGTAVPVRYDPHLPSRGVIDNWVQTGGVMYLVAGLIAGVATCAAVVLIVVLWWSPPAT